MFKRILTFLIIISTTLISQSTTQIDLIFDASGSMWGQIEGVSKIEIARNAMDDLLKDFEGQKDIQLSLRIYGHLNKNCDNSVLEVPMASGNVSDIKLKINSIKPLGKTPIAFSLEKSIDDFSKDLHGEKIIVLITDGLESCNGDICAASQKLKDAGIVTQLHVVGFGMDDNQLATLDCMAQPFGGEVIGAGNAKELSTAFQKISKKAISHNLEIRARDDDGNNITIDYIVTDQNGRSIVSGDNSLSNIAKVSMEPGIYIVKVTNQNTGDEIKYSNVEIKEDDIEKREAIFAERSIEIKVKNQSGEYILVDVYLYDESGNEVKYADTSYQNKATFNVLPGIYSIKVDDYRNSKKVDIDNVDLINNKEFVKEVIIP